MPNVFPDRYFDEDVIPGTPGTYHNDNEIDSDVFVSTNDERAVLIFGPTKKQKSFAMMKLQQATKIADHAHWKDKNCTIEDG